LALENSVAVDAAEAALGSATTAARANAITVDFMGWSSVVNRHSASLGARLCPTNDRI
jgi:hypothetical protein